MREEFNGFWSTQEVGRSSLVFYPCIIPFVRALAASCVLQWCFTTCKTVLSQGFFIC